MSRQERDREQGISSGGTFATTHWDLIRAASLEPSGETLAALDTLCRAYWYPLYSFLRRQGSRPEDAQDLTQGFFHRLLERKYLAQVDPCRGRFRSFLLAALQHFVANQRDRAHTIKRGGQFTFHSMDGTAAERRYAQELSPQLSPDQLYDRAWAMTLLENVLQRLQEEMAAERRARQFDALKIFLTGESPSPSYAELARRLAMTEAAVKMAVHRLRQRYGVLLAEELSRTVADPREIEGELHHLMAVLSR